MSAPLTLALLVSAITQAPGHEPTVEMKVIPYAGWSHCIRLRNERVELVATTDVGPRVIRYAFLGGKNLFKEFADQVGKTGGEKWRSYGGHRLWHAPEAFPRSYAPDNGPVAHDWNGKRLLLTQPTETSTGIGKIMEITLDADSSLVTVRHRLVNHNPWAVRLAPWALTVMAPGGRGIYPQEPYKSHEKELLPARPMVLWHYTDMRDARWTWGTRFIQLRQDPTARSPQKVGLRNSRGWVAYTLRDLLFIKHIPFVPSASYPDFGCNAETYTDKDMLEIESLGPLTTIPPGGAVEHVEHWELHRVEIGTDEQEIAARLGPILKASNARLTRLEEGR